MAQTAPVAPKAGAGSSTPTPLSPWMSLKDYAAAMKISENTAYSLANRGRLGVPAIRVGRQWRVSRAAVDRFFEGLPVGAEAGNG